MPSTENNDHTQTSPHVRWVWFITGPTACGKTTVAKAMAESLGLKFVEGDDYHPPHNREKISHNQPLTDADRAAWLDALAKLESPSPSTPGDTADENLVVTCSALKRKYRDLLRHPHLQASLEGDRKKEVKVRFVFLDVDEEELRERARRRKGHFAGEGLVKSQVETLERPNEDEEGDVVVVRVKKGMGVEETNGEVVRRVKEVLAREGS